MVDHVVIAAHLTGDTFESSNCRNFLIEVTFAGEESCTVYAKLPARELGPRLFANAIGYWGIECDVCRRVAPDTAACENVLLRLAGEPPTTELSPAEDPAKRYRIALVPGLFSECFELFVRPFADVQRDLRAAGFTVTPCFT